MTTSQDREAMTESEEPEVVYEDEFRLGPVRWIVWAHLVLVLTSATLFVGFPENRTLQNLNTAVMLAQTGILLIWLNCCVEQTARQILFVAAYLAISELVTRPELWTPADILVKVLMLPLAAVSALILSLPLAAARRRGWRVKRVLSRTFPAPVPFQFTVRHLLTATLIVAVLFALAEFRAPQKGSDFVALQLIAALLLHGLAIGTYLTWPMICLWAVLTPGAALPRTALIGAGGLFLYLLAFQYKEPPLLDVAAEFAVFAGITLLLVATLALFRLYGYRAVWDNDTSNDGDSENGHETQSS